MTVPVYNTTRAIRPLGKAWRKGSYALESNNRFHCVAFIIGRNSLFWGLGMSYSLLQDASHTVPIPRVGLNRYIVP